MSLLPGFAIADLLSSRRLSFERNIAFNLTFAAALPTFYRDSHQDQLATPAADRI